MGHLPITQLLQDTLRTGGDEEGGNGMGWGRIREYVRDEKGRGRGGRRAG